MKSRHIDKDIGSPSKPTFQSFLNIRKKTLQQFLSEKNISNKEQLNFLLEKLQKEFSFSEDLLSQADLLYITKESSSQELDVTNNAENSYEENIKENVANNLDEQYTQTAKSNRKSKKINSSNSEI